jgi:hypothetical protein
MPLAPTPPKGELTVKSTKLSFSAVLLAIRKDKSRPGYEKRNAITQEIIADLKSRGLFFNTDQGLFLFQNYPTPQLYPIQPGSVPLLALIADRFGINPAEQREYLHIVKGLTIEAHLRGEKVSVRRLSFYDRETGRLYISRFDGSMYRLNGRSALLVPNGTDGVFFWDDPDWRPYEIVRRRSQRKEHLNLLNRLIFDSANVRPSDGCSREDQVWLFSAWLRSHFFSSLLPTKSLLLVCGEKGSGKTLCLRKWLKFLFGPAGEVISLERGKEDGFIAAVSSQPVVVCDNVDEHVSWLADKLAQLSTGISITRRALFTTNDTARYRPQCFIALTSRTPKFMDGRDDVLDRTVILQTERLIGFKSEDALLEEIARNRNLLWTELLRGFNRLLSVTSPAGFRADSVKSRMADFAGFAVAVARAEGDSDRAARILESLENRRTEMLLNAEPIFSCLEKWLEIPANRGREVSSGDLHAALTPVAMQCKMAWPYSSAHSLGQKLAHISTNLNEHFRVEKRRDSANQTHYRFWTVEQRTELATSPAA